MEVIFSKQAIEDLKYWKKTGDRRVQKRISQLINSIQQTPFEGIGKPEALKYVLSGFWSRRINREHRLIYSIENDRVIIHALRYHY